MTENPPANGQPDPDEIQGRIQQLGKQRILETPQMLEFHQWLDGKRLLREPCRVVGESRTGKTIGCDTYRLKQKVKQVPGEAPHIPVVYWLCSENLTATNLFIGLLENLQYQVTRGRVRDLRERTYHVLASCEVEMLILDEAQRATAPAMSEIRDIADEVGISVVLVGTDRLNAVLHRDEQVLYRFLAAYRFGRLETDDLLEMTALWEEHVLQLPEPSDLTGIKAQALLLKATRGYIGVLDRILCGAATQALLQGKKRIDLPLLQQAAKEYSITAR